MEWTQSGKKETATRHNPTRTDALRRDDDDDDDDDEGDDDGDDATGGDDGDAPPTRWYRWRVVGVGGVGDGRSASAKRAPFARSWRLVANDRRRCATIRVVEDE